MRIAFVLQTFGTGGAERVASLLCSYWAEHGHDVTIITFDGEGAERAYPLSPLVSVRSIDALNESRSLAARLAMNVRRVRRLRAELIQTAPDAVVAFTTEANVIALWAARGLRIPVIASERNQPDRPSLGKLHRLARRFAYPLADGLVVQTDDVADWARTRFRVPVHLVPNPVVLADWKVAAGLPEGSARRLVAAGRLVPQKGFDSLIDAFAQLAPAHPEWTLTIYGEGAERPRLQTQIANYGLSDRVYLPGISEAMPERLREADAFVLSSRYEGYPNVLIEALAAGKPVVATNCPGATEKILSGGRYGLLAGTDDTDSLTAALDQLLSDDELRHRLAKLAPEAVVGLDIGIIAPRWVDLLMGVRAARNA